MNLEPVRAALLVHARADATAQVAVARREADVRRSSAWAEAAEVLRRARDEREEATAAARSRSLVCARREARAIILRARRDAYEELRAAALAAAADLRARPDYPQLWDRLADVAREQLGPDAQVTEPDGGGVLARAGERLVDCSLPVLVQRRLADLGPDLEELWR